MIQWTTLSQLLQNAFNKISVSLLVKYSLTWHFFSWHWRLLPGAQQVHGSSSVFWVVFFPQFAVSFFCKLTQHTCPWLTPIEWLTGHLPTGEEKGGNLTGLETKAILWNTVPSLPPSQSAHAMVSSSDQQHSTGSDHWRRMPLLTPFGQFLERTGEAQQALPSARANGWSRGQGIRTTAKRKGGCTIFTLSSIKCIKGESSYCEYYYIHRHGQINVHTTQFCSKDTFYKFFTQGGQTTCRISGQEKGKKQTWTVYFLQNFPK